MPTDMGELIVHKLVRNGAAAATALAAALALTACGSGDGDGGKDGGASAAPSAAAPTGADAQGVSLAAAEGAWVGATDGKPVTLTVSKGGQAVVISEAHVCQGTAKEGAALTLTLTCKDGDTTRTSGTVRSADGTQLVVAWDSGRTDTLSKPAAGVLPSGLPSIPPLPSLPPQP
ncbi:MULTISPECIES: hypothetical protein [Streptomyces]|nr:MULTISPECIES: hypothetical protein [Streptomyces]UUS32281.1 hypothetical protein NRO40_16645 [Streptomyces changanensis]